MNLRHAPRAVAAVCAIACLAPLPRASADFVEIVVQRKTVDDFNRNLVSDLGMPEDLSVWRVFARFDDPTDQLVGVVGSPDHPFHVATREGTGFFNAPAQLNSDRPPFTNIALVIDEVNYDSWFTVGNSLRDATPNWPSGAPSVDQLIISAGTPGPNSDPWPGGGVGEYMAWLIPPFGEDPGSGETVPHPLTVAGNYQGNKVLIMQLVADRDAIIDGTFGLLIVDAEHPEGAEIGAGFETLPLCLGDTNADAFVDVEDIINVILAWGSDDPAADVDGNGVVNVDDLIIVVLNPGPC